MSWWDEMIEATARSECDKCERLKQCEKEGRLINITSGWDYTRHYMLHPDKTCWKNSSGSQPVGGER